MIAKFKRWVLSLFSDEDIKQDHMRREWARYDRELLLIASKHLKQFDPMKPVSWYPLAWEVKHDKEKRNE